MPGEPIVVNPPEEHGLPDLTSRLNVRMNTVRKGYEHYHSNAVFIGITLPVLAVFVAAILTTDFSELWNVTVAVVKSTHSVVIFCNLSLLCLILTTHFLKRPQSVYLLDFSCFEPPQEHKITHERFLEATKKAGLSDEAVDFQGRLLAKSAIGNAAFCEGLLEDPPRLNQEYAMREAKLVLFTVVEDVLKKTNLRPKDIDILIVNCSLFCPTPSLSSMIVNHFKMRSNILSYNLGGMGCSAGLISIDLAKRLLEGSSNKRALVLSTENITQNLYKGTDKSMLVSNTLFREGGAAIVLSNHAADKKKRRFRLLHTVRTHKGGEDESFGCITHREDDTGLMGVSLSKNVMKVAGESLKTNITTLGPLVLPLSEQFTFFMNLMARNLLHRKLPKLIPFFIRWIIYMFADFFLALPSPKNRSLYALFVRRNRALCGLPNEFTEEELKEMRSDKNCKISVGKTYLPNFTKAFEHVCVHAGGRAVLDAIEKNLRLPSDYLNASRFVLNNYGNTSSSSIWYELKYHVKNSSIKKGERCWQIAFGSGFKCNSAVWEACRDIN
jgi:3-ketoacyl-CoA synthase